MKFSTLLFLMFAFCNINAQSLPIDFEGSIVTSDFEDFDGGIATVIANPQQSGINTSATVAQIVRDGGEIWSGSKINLAQNLDFSTNNTISMKVFTTAPVGTIVKFKLEGDGTTERDVPTTVSNEWETLTWDFTGEPTNFSWVVFMFDFGNVGDGSINSTFLFDDVQQFFGGLQIDLPTTFEDPDVNYTTTDFGGNSSELVADPVDANNTVVKVIKTDEAATWAGTTIGTNAGFATYIPLTLTDSKMTVKVWSPTAGTPIRLKVEDHNDPTHTCETETNTTLAGEWEVMEFDFTNEAPGTQSLSIGLSMGWAYNMASIFFNFGTEGVAAGEQTYYFDDVSFGDFVINSEDITLEEISVFPNPSNNEWTISTENIDIQKVEIFDLQGRLLETIISNNPQVVIDAINFESGIYIAQITANARISNVKLLKH